MVGFLRLLVMLHFAVFLIYTILPFFFSYGFFGIFCFLPFYLQLCIFAVVFFFRRSCNKVESLKRISVLLISLSNVGVVDLEVCFPIFGTLHSAPRYFNIIDRSELSVGPAPHSIMHILKIFTFELYLFRFCVAFFLSRFLFS